MKELSGRLVTTMSSTCEFLFNQSAALNPGSSPSESIEFTDILFVSAADGPLGCTTPKLVVKGRDSVHKTDGRVSIDDNTKALTLTAKTGSAIEWRDRCPDLSDVRITKNASSGMTIHTETIASQNSNPGHWKKVRGIVSKTQFRLSRSETREAIPEMSKVITRTLCFPILAVSETCA